MIRPSAQVCSCEVYCASIRYCARRGEIVEHVLLLRQHAFLVPALADIPRRRGCWRWRKCRLRRARCAASRRGIRRLADAIAAIAVKQPGLSPSSLRALLADDVDRNSWCRPSMSRIRAPLRRRRTKWARSPSARSPASCRSPDSSARNSAAADRSRRRIEYVAIVERFDLAVGRDVGQRQLAFRLAVEIEDAHLIGTADDVAHEQPIGLRVEIRHALFGAARQDGDVAFGNDDRRVGQRAAREGRASA